MVGFHGEKIMSIRLILEMGMPSISHLLNTPFLMNQMEFLNIKQSIPGYTWVIVLGLILVGTFMQGGYITHLYKIITNGRMTFSEFMRHAKQHWSQFVILEMIIYFGKIAVTGFLVIFFGIIGVFASLVFFLFIRVVLIYLEFSIVVDKTNIVIAVRHSKNYLKKSFIPTLILVLLMYLFSGILSLTMHMFWQLPVIIGGIIVYAYGMTIIQASFMLTLLKAKEKL
jgi:hypothetical protein